VQRLGSGESGDATRTAWRSGLSLAAPRQREFDRKSRRVFPADFPDAGIGPCLRVAPARLTPARLLKAVPSARFRRRVDGTLGDDLAAAVTSWRTTTGLHAGGIVGPRGWRSLDAR